MTIVASDAAELAALNAILALINGGSGDATGDFELQTGGAASLAVLPFSATSFGNATTVSNQAQATSNAITNSGTPTAGTIGIGKFRDKSNAAVMTFTISASGGGGDMIVTDPVIPGNATAVSCSGVTVTLNVTN
jgi:hypothetical protein